MVLQTSGEGSEEASSFLVGLLEEHAVIIALHLDGGGSLLLHGLLLHLLLLHNWLLLLHIYSLHWYWLLDDLDVFSVDRG